MAELKTKATGASVSDYITSHASDEQRSDCKKLMAMFRKVTGHKAKMWGPSIVGYGRYRYTYESGRTGEICSSGFSIRGRELVVYVTAESSEQKARLARLGKHKMGKSCLYFKRLADLDMSVLEEMVVASRDELKRRYGESNVE